MSIDGRIRASSTISREIGVRVIVDGKEGFSYTSSINQGDIKKAVKKQLT